MKSEKINQLLEELVEKLTFYRSEDAITFYAPYKFDLKKRIEQLEIQIKRIREFANENPNKEIEFEALQNLHSSLINESHFATNFDKLSSIFVENSKNVVIGNVITADKIHIGDNYYYQYGEKKIKRFLTKLPYNEAFEGRKKELAELKEKIATQKNISLISINGIGGIGKSALSKAFLLENYKEYDFALFLEGKSTVYDTFNDYTLLDNLEIAEKINSIPYQTPNRNEKVFEIIKNTLSNLEGKKLLLIDDASETSHLLKDLIQSDWEILTTSRQKIDFMYSFELLQATPNDAIAIFCVYYGKAIETLHQKEKTQIQRLVNRLALHPLAIELVAKNIKRKDWTFEETNQKLAEKGLNIDEKTNLTTTHTQEKIKDIFEYLLQLFPLENLTEEELKLLTIYSVLPNQPITKQTWKTLLGETEDHWQELSTQLNERGLINRNQKAFEIHALLAEIVRYKNEERLDGDCEGMMISLVDKLNPETNFNYHKENYKYTSLYIRYTESIMNYIEDNYEKALLYERIGDFYTEQGKLIKALEVYEKCQYLSTILTKRDINNSEFKYELATSYSKVGTIHEKLGKLEKALYFFERQTELLAQLYNDFPNNIYFKNGLAISYCMLGKVYKELGSLILALVFFSLHNDFTSQMYKDFPDDINLKKAFAISCQFLGQVNQELGNLRKALVFFDNQTSLFKQLYNDFPNNVDFKNGLAVSFEKLGQINQKLDNLQFSLLFFETQNKLLKQLYNDFPNSVNFKNGLAISYSKLGEVHQQLKNSQISLICFNKYFMLIEELNNDFPENVNFKNGFAISFIKKGFYFESKNDIKRAKANYLGAKEVYLELTNRFPNYAEFQYNLQIIESKLNQLQ
ncbi:tetratricopeptide repeat protein [Bernardetia sp. MNP-M8]|uniref:tetratricopeptide repeat protein n=1 Tax=Bernardetia sp. MNP-M8 TaxID=3127470 RepID=UPI0030D62D55